jgi:hypothetical protein
MNVGEELRFIEKLGRLQRRQAGLHSLLREGKHRVQYGQGHIHADDRRGLQQPFVVWWQAVDTGCEDGLHGSGHRQRL